VLTNVVLRALPLNRTAELLLKFVPFTVKVKARSPANFVVGDKLLTVGTGLFIVKINGGVDVPPPGVGFVTVTEAVSPVEHSEAAICAVNCVEFTKVAV
jgi:hypothetical protein